MVRVEKLGRRRYTRTEGKIQEVKIVNRYKINNTIVQSYPRRINNVYSILLYYKTER